MQEEVDIRPEEEEDEFWGEETGEGFEEFEEEESLEMDEVDDVEGVEDMEPDESLEPAGEQSPNTREAFEEEQEEDLLMQEE